MHKGSGLISLKVQEARNGGSQKARSQDQFSRTVRISRISENSSNAKIHSMRKNSRSVNFSACARLPGSHFQPKTTPFCIFSNFTPDVITFAMGILVFHFFVRLYIAILLLWKGDGLLER